MVGVIFRAFSPRSPAKTASPNPDPELFGPTEFLDQGQDLASDVLGGQRTNMAKTDVAGAVHDISFRHTINPKIDRRHAVAVDPDMTERVAEAVQKTARLFGLVLIRDAVERDPGEAAQRHQFGVLFAARSAPRREEVDERHAAVEIVAGQSVGALVKTGQGEIGRRAVY